MESDGERRFILGGIAKEGQHGQSRVRVKSRGRRRLVHVVFIGFVKEGTSFKV